MDFLIGFLIRNHAPTTKHSFLINGSTESINEAKMSYFFFHLEHLNKTSLWKHGIQVILSNWNVSRSDTDIFLSCFLIYFHCFHSTINEKFQSFWKMMKMSENFLYTFFEHILYCHSKEAQNKNSRIQTDFKIFAYYLVYKQKFASYFW